MASSHRNWVRIFVPRGVRGDTWSSKRACVLHGAGWSGSGSHDRDGDDERDCVWARVVVTRDETKRPSRRTCLYVFYRRGTQRGDQRDALFDVRFFDANNVSRPSEDVALLVRRNNVVELKMTSSVKYVVLSFAGHVSP